MTIQIPNLEKRIKEAVAIFWKSRNLATETQQNSGVLDHGNRSAVTAGKHLDGFVNLIKTIVVENGLDAADVITTSNLVTLPGFFRPTKKWDILIIHKGLLVAALELKSQVGPSFGNNFNNRCEEAIGTVTDLWTAFREGGLGKSPKPFVGYLILLEDCEGTSNPVRESSPNFPVFPEFQNVSYAKRYEILCDKLVKENLYSATALILSPSEGGRDGEYTEPSEISSLNRLMIGLASQIATIATIEQVEK
jgi:hypothetical protein